MKNNSILFERFCSAYYLKDSERFWVHPKVVSEFTQISEGVRWYKIALNICLQTKGPEKFRALYFNWKIKDLITKPIKWVRRSPGTFYYAQKSIQTADYQGANKIQSKL